MSTDLSTAHDAVNEYLQWAAVEEPLRQLRLSAGSFLDLPAGVQPEWQTVVAEQKRILDTLIHPVPERSLRLLLKLLQDFPSINSQRDLLDYVPAESFSDIFECCLPALGLTTTKEAEAQGLVLAKDCLEKLFYQAPELFHPYLHSLWDTWRDTNGSDFTQAWQDSGTRHHAELIACLTDPQQQRRHWGAEICLERSACVEAFEWLRQHRGKTLLEEAGVAYQDGQWRPLYPTSVYHLYVSPETREEQFQTGQTYAGQHPDDLSWRIEGNGIPAQFWGEEVSSCPECGEGLQHLLTLSHPVPGVLINTPLRFVGCLSCMISERPTYFQHDESGIPSLWPLQEAQANAYDVVASTWAVEFRLTPRRWYVQQQLSGNQNLSRVGGPPSWLQGPEYLECPECAQLMLFLFQIGNGVVRVGDIVYGFWCESCRISALLKTYT